MPLMPRGYLLAFASQAFQPGQERFFEPFVLRFTFTADLAEVHQSVYLRTPTNSIHSTDAGIPLLGCRYVRARMFFV